MYLAISSNPFEYQLLPLPKKSSQRLLYLSPHTNLTVIALTMVIKPTVLITGCSDDGIGSGLALTFHERGYHVFATARNIEKMTKLRDVPDVTLLTLDVLNQAHIDAAVQAVQKHTGGTLNYLVNNAGRNHFMPVLDEDLDFTRKMFDTNVWAPVTITQAFAPLLIRAKGTAVFITSIAGHLNVPYMGVYSASKRALEVIAETLRLELAPFHVGVLSIVTGAVKTLGQTYFGDFKLPENSLYRPIQDTIAGRARGEDGKSRADLMTYAKQVVSQITSGASGKFWCGDNAESVKYGSTHLPPSAMDSGVVRDTGLDVLAAQNQE